MAPFTLDDAQLHVLVHQRRIIFAVAQRGLRARHKHAHVFHQGHKPARVGLGDVAVHNLAALYGGGHFFLTLVFVKTALREIDNAFLIVHFRHNEVELVTFLDQIFRFGRRVISEFLKLDETCLLCADIHLDLAGPHCRDDALHDLPAVYRLQGSINHFLKAQFLFTNFLAHTAQYLLNDRRWRGRPRRHPHGFCTQKPFRLKLSRCFHRIGPCVFCRNSDKLLRIGRLSAPDDDHHIAPARKALCLFLPRLRSITYCIKNKSICIEFFQKLCAFSPFFHFKRRLGNHINAIFSIFWNAKCF